IVELDPEKLNAELAHRGESLFSGWPGWEVAGSEKKPCLVSIAWDQHRPPARRCRVEVAPREAFFTIGRRLAIGERDRFLVLSVSRLEKDSGPSRIQARFDGRAIAEFDVPIHTGPGDPDPLLIPVNRYRGKEVDIELV